MERQSWPRGELTRCSILHKDTFVGRDIEHPGEGSTRFVEKVDILIPHEFVWRRFGKLLIPAQRVADRERICSE